MTAEPGFESIAERLEQRLRDAELELRLGRDPAAAERALRAVLDEAVAGSDPDALVRAQVGLGLAARARGDVPAAVVLLEAAAGSGRISPLAHPDVFVTLAQTYAHLGAAERGIALLESCLDAAESGGSEETALTIRYSTHLSDALASAGEHARAERVIVAALTKIGDDAGPLERVRLRWALARIEEAGGHVAAALEHILASIKLLEPMDDALFLGRAHMVAATLLMSSDKYIQAGRHLQAAARAFGPDCEPRDRALLRMEESRRATGLGAPAEGVALAREALELLGRDDPSFRGAAHRSLAGGLGATGDSRGAIASYGTAVELLEQTGQWREAADTCTAWGRYLRSLGRDREALDAFDRAASLASRVKGIGLAHGLFAAAG